MWCEQSLLGYLVFFSSGFFSGFFMATLRIVFNAASLLRASWCRSLRKWVIFLITYGRVKRWNNTLAAWVTPFFSGNTVVIGFKLLLKGALAFLVRFLFFFLIKTLKMTLVPFFLFPWAVEVLIPIALSWASPLLKVIFQSLPEAACLFMLVRLNGSVLSSTPKDLLLTKKLL